MRKRATVANAPALEAYLAWVHGGTEWPRVPGERCPQCHVCTLVAGAGYRQLVCSSRYQDGCLYNVPACVNGVTAETRLRVLDVGDTSQRSRWRNGRRSPGTA